MEIERGAKTLSRRQTNQTEFYCSNPDCGKPLNDGSWVSRFEIRDKQTGVSRMVTSCSERCHIINNRVAPFATASLQAGGRGLVRT